jgi:hypothetical protein
MTSHHLASTFVYFIELLYWTQADNRTASSDANLSLQKIKIKIKMYMLGSLVVSGPLFIMLLL